MVIIKSYPNGISLHVEENKSFDEVLKEVATKFEESRRFFKNASVAVSVEGRVLSASEERDLIQTIEEHSDIQIVCLVGKNEDTNKKFIKALKRVEVQKEENNGRFYKGNVLEGQVIESEGNLVVYGSVMKGATVAAHKDVIILGELLGEVFAGLDNEKGHFVTASHMNPERCKIGELVYRTEKNGLFDKRKNEPCIIYEKNGTLVCELTRAEAVINATTI